MKKCVHVSWSAWLVSSLVVAAVLSGCGNDSAIDCGSGYVPGADGKSCDDADECAIGNGGCSQLCVNSAGSHTCSCGEGYVLADDGKACDDVDECATGNGGCAQLCTNIGGSYACGCEPGYVLAAEGKACDDVDECTIDNGGCAETCANLPGGFACSCASGYALGLDGKACEDVDECATDNGGCAQSCANAVGSHSCSCGAGFLLASDGHACDDVDECASGNGGCAQNCANVPGSFSCGCNPGYALASDGKACEDVDECAGGNGGCAQTCTNIGGSYSCSCGQGYVLAADGRACDDPPAARIDWPYGYEDTPVVIRLKHWDVEGDPVQYVVDSLEETVNLEGRLFQYDGALASGDLSAIGSAVEITAFPTTVTDALGRVVYLGAANCNGDSIPAELMVYPYLTFHVREVGYADGDLAHVSPPVRFPIYLEAVNDAPVAWAPATAPGSVCWQSCAFDEDLGQPSGSQLVPATLYAGGRDVEHSGMSVVVTEHTCPPGTLFYVDGTTEVVAPFAPVPGFADGELKPALLFKPLPNAFVAGAPYCSVTYKVNDGELDSAGTNTIELYVSPVNDLPTLAERHVTAWEDTPQEFDLNASDLDSGSFTGTIMSCTDPATGGQLEFLDPTTNGFVAIDCSALASAPALVATSSSATWHFRYTPPATMYGDGLMQLRIKLDDGQGTAIAESDWRQVQLDVVPVNEAPLIGLGNQPLATTFSLDWTVDDNSDVALSFLCDDVDAGSGHLTWTITTDNGTFNRLDLTEEEISGIHSLQNSISRISFMTTLAEMKVLVTRLSIHVGASGSQSIVNVTLTDNGNTGVCQAGDAAGGSCPRSASGQIVLHAYRPGVP